MLHHQIVIRAWQVGLFAAASLIGARAAHSRADQSKGGSTCVSAYQGAMKLEQEGHLRDAQRMLLNCAKATCGAVLRQQCLARHTQLDQDIPSVVPIVTNTGGQPVVDDVQVKMDGEVLTQRIDGRAAAVDPGLHQFSFETEMGVFAKQEVVILQGQRNRPITATLPAWAKPVAKPVAAKPAPAPAPVAAAPTPAPVALTVAPPVEAPGAVPMAAVTEPVAVAPSEPTGPRGPSSNLGPYLLGGAGLVGIGGYALLTYWGRKDNDKLSECSPACNPSSVDHIRKLYVAADVSLGVGIAALVGATSWWYIKSRPSKESVAVDVQPIRSGALASVKGAF
jgi:hypothetical protein